MNHRARTRASLVLALVLTTLVFLLNPTTAGRQLRSVVGLGHDLTFTITDTGSGEGYEFALMQPDGRGPVAWNPCRAIPYVVNPEGAPSGYADLVATAVTDIARASGLRFEYDGTTDDRTFRGRVGRFGAAPPVLVAWASSEELSELAGDVAGIGGGEAVRTGTDHLTYVSGMVALDRDGFAEIGERENGAALQRAVVEHELGHVVGLGHVDDPGQLMYEETTSQSHLGTGDREGLQILGSGRCP